MYFLHSRISVPLLHPVVEDGFQIRRCNVPHDFLSYEREHLVLGSAFQPVVCCAFHRGELENLQPMCQAFLYGFLRFVRIAHLCVKLGDVVGDLLLGLRLSFAGEGLSFLLSLLVKVPDDALPAAIGTAKDVAVGGESLLWHG